MSLPPPPPQNTRLGFQYYPDTCHFRKCDLETWLPELQSLGVSWLVLAAPASRAIPEHFLRGLLEAGIEPVLQLHLPLDPACRNPDHSPESLDLLFSLYAQWGVHYLLPFDRPNLRLAWAASAWAQADLVERFLDLYLPVAHRALEAGLLPVFPALEPGGDYWDTAFLRAALRGLQRRGHDSLLKSLVLSAVARTDRRPLGWGAGGPERWPGKRPYSEAGPGEDQQGFYIFDWYLAVAQAALGMPLPILLFEAGKFRPAASVGSQQEEFNLLARAAEEEEAHTRRSLALVQLLFALGCAPGDAVQTAEGPLDPVSPYVLACNLWLLAAEPGSPYASEAWYSSAGEPLPAVAALRAWRTTGQEELIRQ